MKEMGDLKNDFLNELTMLNTMLMVFSNSKIIENTQ